MARGYVSQPTITALATTTLTASYNSTVAFTREVGGQVESVLYITYITGTSETGTTLSCKIESGPTNSDVYRVTTISTSSGTVTVSDGEWQRAGGAGATTYKYQIPITIGDKFMKVSFKETGVSSNFGSVAVKLQTSGK